MAYNVTATTGNYVDSVYYAVVDSSGYVIGPTSTAPVAGNDAGTTLTRLLGVQNFPFSVVDSDRPTQKGDGGAIARFVNKPTDLPEAQATFGAWDLTFAALAQGMKVATVGGGSFMMGQPLSPTAADLMFVVQAPAKSTVTATLGSATFEGLIILKANVQPRGRDSFQTDSLPTYQYSMIGNYASAYPWGHAFTAADEGDTECAILYFTWPYRLMIDRFTLDGTEVTYTLNHQLAEDSAENVNVFINGTAQTWAASGAGAGEFSTDTATNIITLGGAGTTAHKMVVLYGITGS